MVTERTLKIHDSKGFQYEVDVKHSPTYGFSTAYYRGAIIAQVDSYRLLQPHSDNDKEWEDYEERLAGWMDENELDLQPACIEHFDNL